MRKALRIVVLAAIVGVALGVEAFAGETNTNAVVFDVKVVGGGSRWGPPQTTWQATYTKDGKTAEFDITLPHKAAGAGIIARVEGSESAVLIRDLGEAIGGVVPDTVDQGDELTVTFIVLGNQMTKTAAGSFKGGGQGDWLLVKIFVAHDQAEFYLNINETAGKGEIVRKDPDDGDKILEELAKVLTPFAIAPTRKP